MDIYSLTGMAGHTVWPSIVGYVRTLHVTDFTPHWAIGNLNGVFGKVTNVYGVGLGRLWPAATTCSMIT